MFPSGHVKDSLFLFGHGDGGGGPTEEMLHRLETLAAVPGLPFTAAASTPDQFFFALEKSLAASSSAAAASSSSAASFASSASLCTWVGELYLELHQGTFTSQVSRGNEDEEILIF